MQILFPYYSMYLLAIIAYVIKRPLKKINLNGFLFLINFISLVFFGVRAVTMYLGAFNPVVWVIQIIGLMILLGMIISSYNMKFIKKYECILPFMMTIQLSALFLGMLLQGIYDCTDSNTLSAVVVFSIYSLYLVSLHLLLRHLIKDKIHFDHEEHRNRIAEEMIPVIEQVRMTQHEYSNILSGLGSNYQEDPEYRKVLIHQKNDNQFESFGKVAPILTTALYLKSKQLDELNIDFSIRTWLDNLDIYIVNPKEYEIVSIIMNLINNATEAILNKRCSRSSIYEGTRDQVRVDLNTLKGSLIIKVGNSGSTIDFEKFGEWLKIGYTTKKEGHHGYGLHIVLGIVNKYKGNVTLERGDNLDYIVVNL